MFVGVLGVLCHVLWVGHVLCHVIVDVLYVVVVVVLITVNISFVCVM